MSASTFAARSSVATRPLPTLIAGRSRRHKILLAAAVAAAGIGIALAVRDPRGALDVARNAAIVLGVITLIVSVHEFAHLVVARLLGIGATTYAIGFGKVLASKHAAGVDWQIRALPFGGFVSLRGEQGDDGPGSFSSAAAWKRIVVLLAGPASNIVLAVGLLTGLLMVMAHLPALQALTTGWSLLIDIIRMTIDALAAWLPNAIARPLDAPLVGLPGMVAQTGQLLDIGPYMLVILAAAFSCSAGFLNALPIPPLDGGQAFLVVVRALSRGHANEKLLGRVQVVGLRALLVFSGGITALDLVRLLAQSGH